MVVEGLGGSLLVFALCQVRYFERCFYLVAILRSTRILILQVRNPKSEILGDLPQVTLIVMGGIWIKTQSTLLQNHYEPFVPATKKIWGPSLEAELKTGFPFSQSDELEEVGLANEPQCPLRGLKENDKRDGFQWVFPGLTPPSLEV